MKHHQVSKRSGLSYPFTLDDSTLVSLCATQEKLERIGHKLSQGIIVRRAIRKYYDELISPTIDIVQELIELQRAAKGIK